MLCRAGVATVRAWDTCRTPDNESFILRPFLGSRALWGPGGGSENTPRISMPPDRQRQTSTSPPTDSSEEVPGVIDAVRQLLAAIDRNPEYMSQAYSMGRRTESSSTACGTPSTGPRTRRQCGSVRKEAADSGTPATRPRHGSLRRQLCQRHRQQGPSNRQGHRHRHTLLRQSSRQRWCRQTSRQ